MLVLWEKDKQTVSDIGIRLLLNSNTLTPILKKMINKDLIEKKRSKSNERKVVISLTEPGKILKTQAEKVPVALLQNIDTSNKDLIKIQDLMWQFLKNLTKS